jgi:uncharacterized protein (DUF2141 family)
MLKFSLPLIALAALTVATPALPAAAGRDAKACQSGKPSVIVRMSGFKKASGRVKIGVYPANTYLKKRGTVAKQTLPLRSTAPMDVCLTVPGPGRYAVVVHHDLNNNSDRDMNDGVAYSNNPRLGLTSLKAPFGRTAVQVGNRPQRVNVVLQYRKGLSVGPVNS